MAKEKREADVPLNTHLRPLLRKQLEAYIDAQNRDVNSDHRTSIRSTVEAALREFLKSKGFWPPSKS
jgi:hypothetical protein